jgi:hypothetical protein
MGTDDIANQSTAALHPGTAFAQTVLHALGDPATKDAPRPALPAGASRYVLARVLGEGGMGTVVEARDLQFARSVAVKTLHRDRAGVGARERFSLEALVTGNLEHPGVPTVYERGLLDDGTPYYAMRLVRGRTLAQVIADAPDLTARLKLVPVVIKIAQTLGFAHERGIVHRDVKPENVVVGRYGETVMLDWGIAKVRGMARTGDPVISAEGAPRGAGSEPAAGSGSGSGSSTRVGSILGTPAYMAPEQAAGDVDKIDERTDVFALGALLYHLLTGRAPYDGPTAASVVGRAAKVDVEPLTSAAPGAPAGIRTICERAMARSPDDRYQTAAEVADALESYTAEAVAGRESSAMRWLSNALAAVGLAVPVIVGTISALSLPTLREQGRGATAFTVLAAVGVLVSLLELRTRGRYTLSPVALALALSVMFLGVGTSIQGATKVLAYAARPEVFDDPVQYRDVMTTGMREALGGLSWGALLAAVQVILWGIARRSVLRAKR